MWCGRVWKKAGMWITNTATGHAQMGDRDSKPLGKGETQEPEAKGDYPRKGGEEVDKISFNSRLMDYVKSFFLGSAGR